ncbi:hypothetical protein ELY33_17050 [Vreelandella andesensis]|uniref:Uncharacterized protein n=1 Tax=Vreelandella andesensis TaxID=447567 RepID=A0A433KF65_9GAMM|nr:hypothetical protein [Halomonas andesensis]RUR26815.1 hypothetical protein ELY33_17050 [Halomonas andesensis]
MMLKEIIDSIGTNRLARECGVTDVAVVSWKQKGLPVRRGNAQKRRAHYERVIARMAGMKVGELRELLAKEEAEHKQAA